MGEKSFTSRVANAVTRSVPSSGKSSPTSTVLTQPAATTVTPISSLRESTSTTTKPPVAVMFLALSSWISSQALWTPSVLDLSVSSSDQTTSSSVRLVPVTTGPRVTTPRVPSSSTPSSMSSVRRLRAVTAFRASRSPTLSVVALAPAWELSSSPRSVRNTQTDRCALSLSCHPPRSPIPSSSPTTLPSLSISSSRTPMMSCALTTRLFTISASEPSSSPPQPTVILTISPPFPRSAQLRPPQARCQPRAIPPSPFLHDGIRPSHLPWFPAIPCPHRPRAHPADVRCQEHGVRFRPPSRSLPHRLRCLPWPHVHQGGR